MNDDKTLGQLAFEAYCAEAGGVVIYGRLIDDWALIGPKMQAAWYAGALAAIEAIYLSRQPKRLPASKTKAGGQRLLARGKP